MSTILYQPTNLQNYLLKSKEPHFCGSFCVKQIKYTLPKV